MSIGLSQILNSVAVPDWSILLVLRLNAYNMILKAILLRLAIHRQCNNSFYICYILTIHSFFFSLHGAQSPARNPREGVLQYG